jgi:hypothetical protein
LLLKDSGKKSIGRNLVTRLVGAQIVTGLHYKQPAVASNKMLSIDVSNVKKKSRHRGSTRRFVSKIAAIGI